MRYRMRYMKYTCTPMYIDVEADSFNEARKLINEVPKDGYSKLIEIWGEQSKRMAFVSAEIIKDDNGLNDTNGATDLFTIAESKKVKPIVLKGLKNGQFNEQQLSNGKRKK
jgi:hypothetical protein